MTLAHLTGAGRFFKAVAGGNDFLVVDVPVRGEPAWTARDVTALCSRRTGLGADGLVALLPAEAGRAEEKDATARFLLWNADGSRAELSGNGSRCAARVLHELGRTDHGLVCLATERAGLRQVRVSVGAAGASASVDLPLPTREKRGLTLPPGAPAPRGDHAVVGVPYLAVPVRDVDGLDLPSVAPPLRRWDVFPEGANVAFYVPPAGASAPVRLRTWERGVEGETPSSGTGAAAVALAVLAADGRLGANGEHLVTLAPRGGWAVVRATVKRHRLTTLTLEGDVRLLGEVVPHRELFVPAP